MSTDDDAHKSLFDLVDTNWFSTGITTQSVGGELSL